MELENWRKEIGEAVARKWAELEQEEQEESSRRILFLGVNYDGLNGDFGRKWQ